MNRVHDMGGMQGFGPVHPEKNPPVFRKRWEGRITAIYSAIGVQGKWAIDFRRQTRELLPPAEYLSLNYYQLLYALIVQLLTASGIHANRDRKRTTGEEHREGSSRARRRRRCRVVCARQLEEA